MANWKHTITVLLIIYLIPSPGDVITKKLFAGFLGISVMTFILISYPLAIWLLWELNKHNKIGIKIRYYYDKYKPLVIIGIILALNYLFASVKKEFGGLI